MMRDQLAAALGRIAVTVSATLDLREVFGRVAEVSAEILDFDAIAIMQAKPDGGLALHSFAGTVEDPVREMSPADFSPALLHVMTTGGRSDDLSSLLDTAFPMDRRLHEDGNRSGIVAPIRRGGRLDAVVSCVSRRVAAFGKEDEQALRSIADLLGLALEHERLWRCDLARRRRLDAVDALLPTIAKTLDIRAIFDQVSTIVHSVLAHDRLALVSLSDDRRTITVDALSGEPLAPPARNSFAAHAHGSALLETELVADLDIDPQEDRREWSRALGVRSLLRIPLPLPGGEIGALIFLSKQPNAYADDDVLVARRVADYVGLALSYQRLAEEERISAEAKDRAGRLEQRVEELRTALATSRGFRRVVGKSKAWTDVLKQAAQVAPTETTVLLTGESGTGKEVVARLIYRGSARSRGPFVALNCAALPESLLESELFGHEKGAFTGATAARPGAIEQAAGGVLFLDEVGEMSRSVQAKFLRVLQEREFQRLGAAKPRKADVRVIAATNRALPDMIARGEFRADLYYRLRVFEVCLPPLRERVDDILSLAEAFLEELGPLVGRPAAGIAKEAREALLAYPWPGNVRELRNVLERATILCDGGLVTSEHLPREVADRPAPVVAVAPHEPAQPAALDLDSVDRAAIVRALAAAGKNRSQAARLLGITRQQLYHRLRKFGLDDASR